MSKKSKHFPYKEIVKNCKSLYGANLLLAALLVRKLKKKSKSRAKTDLLCCRTCLRTDQLELIFGEDDGTKISGDLLLATGLEIHKDDGLPQTICSPCIKNINTHLAFREDCKLSQEKLLNIPYPQPLPTEEISNINEDIVPEIKTEIDWLDIYKNNTQDNIEITDNYDHVYDQGLEQYEESEVKVKVERKVKKKKNSPPYKCHICKKHMANASSLKTHLNWHSGLTSYICESCGKRCINRTAFLQHMKGKHGLQRTDKCRYCDYLALNKEQLKIHERRHTGERPYICAHCGAGFHRRANLIQHLPIHLTIKNIQCDLCPSTFKSAKFLATHKSRAHSNKNYSYKCHICNSVYKKSFNVRKHLMKVHSVPREQQGDVLRFRVRCFGDAVYEH